MDAHPLKLKLRSAEAETPFIRRLVFGVEISAVLQWQAGAHIRDVGSSQRDLPAIETEGADFRARGGDPTQR